MTSAGVAAALLRGVTHPDIARRHGCTVRTVERFVAKERTTNARYPHGTDAAEIVKALAPPDRPAQRAGLSAIVLPTMPDLANPAAVRAYVGELVAGIASCGGDPVQVAACKLLLEGWGTVPTVTGPTQLDRAAAGARILAVTAGAAKVAPEPVLEPVPGRIEIVR